MRFGLFFQAAEAPGQTHAERFGEMLDLIALGDALGLSEIICWFDQGGRLPRAEVERAMQRFADDVMPKLSA